MKILDTSNFLLEVVSLPIKNYLRERKDTMRWIITTILTEDDNSLKQDLGKQYIKTSQINIFKSNREKDEYDFLSSDEDEADAENWEPLPMNDGLVNEMTNKSKMSDIISSLVNIFGSPEKFIEQYKRMLAERCVSDNNFSIENEIKNLELLKIKFGENMFQGCDIIIKDVKDSFKINTSVKTLLHKNKNHQNFIDNEFDLNSLIINKNFWPFKEESLFSLDDISKSTENNFKILKILKEKIENYKKVYSSLKFSRTLDFYSNVGYVELCLTFDNGTFDFRVTPLSAIIINLFDERTNFEWFTVENISDALSCNNNDVKKKLNFWVNAGVLSENSNRSNFVNENNFINYEDNQTVFYEPNKILKNQEIFNQIINEDDIYKFEYVEIQNTFNLENAVCSILKNSGPKNFEQLFKNLVMSYQITISEIKLREILGKLTLDQKIFKEGEFYKLIIYTV